MPVLIFHEREAGRPFYLHKNISFTKTKRRQSVRLSQRSKIAFKNAPNSHHILQEFYFWKRCKIGTSHVVGIKYFFHVPLVHKFSLQHNTHMVTKVAKKKLGNTRNTTSRLFSTVYAQKPSTYHVLMYRFVCCSENSPLYFCFCA